MSREPQRAQLRDETQKLKAQQKKTRRANPPGPGDALSTDELSRSILEYAGEAIMVCDNDGYVLRVSRAALTYCDGDPVGRLFFETFSLQKEKTGERFSIAPALQGIPVLQTEVELHISEKKAFYMLASASPLPLSDAKIGCVVVMTDITQRKVAEEERERVLRRLIHISSTAQQQAGELAAVFSSLAEPVIIFDSEGVIVRINKSACYLLGSDSVGETLEELAEKTDLRLADKTRPTVHALISSHALSGETITSIEYSLVNARGERRTLTCSASPIRSGGKITGAVVVLHDITERRWAEDALKRSEKRFRTLSETSTFGLIISDLKGKINYANPAVLKMLGYAREDVSGGGGSIRMEALTPAEYEVRDRKAIKELHKNGMCTPYEKELFRKDGTRIHVLVGSSVIEETPDGRKEAASFITDLSALKQAERELKSIEWLLTRNIQSKQGHTLNDESHIFPQANTSGEIHQSASKDILVDIMGDYLDLLGTSAAVHERDGSYALAVCSSEWCRLLNSLQYHRCLRDADKGGEPALQYCSQSCWKNASLKAMREGKPVDVAGRDGMSIYAVPVMLSDGEVVGALHFCYGSPPQDEATLQNIARTYNISETVLRKKAASHEKRPPFIIDIAKNRLQSSARLIGVIVERKRARGELQSAHDEMEMRVDERTAELTQSNKRLQKEIDERLKTQDALSQKQQALESVYVIATTFGNNLAEVQGQIVKTLAGIIDVPFVAAEHIDQDGAIRGTFFQKGSLSHYDKPLIEGNPWRAVYQEQMICQLQGHQLERVKLSFPAEQSSKFKAFLGVPVRDSAGELTGTICILDEKERYYSEYEVHLVEIYARYIGYEISRTRLEQQLLYSQQMKLLGRIATGVAHEVRNPLNAILAISEALFDDMADNAEYQPYVEHIRRQVTRLSILMRDLLDLGRPQRHFDFKKEAIVPVLQEAVAEWKDNYKKSDSAVKVIIPEIASHWYAGVDKDRIKQVIINLLENSCDHNVSDAPVSLEIESAKNDRLLIRISDRGAGIAAENLDRLFQPFFTTRTGGTGLGLSVVKHILEVHGGGISVVNNDPPPGTTAELWLPMVS